MIKKFFRFLYWKFYDWRHPYKKRPFGITCYVGLYGQGKTLSLSEKLMRLKFEFPKAKIYTNFYWKYQDGILEHWTDLVKIQNGDDGVIFGIDEVSSVWDRWNAKKLPPEIMELFRENRKMAKMIVATAQNFNKIVIDFRDLCQEIIEVKNIGKRWIFQRAFHIDDWKEKDGEFNQRRRLWRYNFIANNFIYESFDSFLKIENISNTIINEIRQEEFEKTINRKLEVIDLDAPARP